MIPTTPKEAAMRKVGLAFGLVLVVFACGDTSDPTGAVTIDEADQACREFCADAGPDCGPNDGQSVQSCYEDCIEGYSYRVARECPDVVDSCYQGPLCPNEWWAANYGCYLSTDCNDQFGDCDDIEAALNACLLAYREGTAVWCEDNCPDDEVCGRFASGFDNRVCGLEL
jgi:hypothetical protein